MNAVVRAWGRFWFAPMDAVPVALFRIALGSLIVADLVLTWPNWDRFYAADGVLSLHDPSVNPATQGWWSLLWWTDGVLPVRTYWWLAMTSALAFTAGWHTRVATVVLFLVEASLVHRTPVVVNGEDLIVRMLLFYACFASLGAAWSLDARRRARRGLPPVQAERWPIRCMQINVALVYLISQPYKLVSDPAWLDGDAMYYVMINATWSRFPWPWLYYDPIVTRVSTWGSLAIELALPLCVWFAPLRRWVVLAAAALHLSIAITLQNVTFFSLAMCCSFFVFLTMDDLERLAALARRLLGRRTPTPAVVPPGELADAASHIAG